MKPYEILEVIKGVHPGKFIERELQKRSINKRQFALSINEHPQTIGAIINGKRRMNVALSLKIEENLQLEEGFLMTLQVHFDIKMAKFDSEYKPDLSKFRKGLFWDTTFDRIDWEKMKIGVVKRVFSRGNDEEKAEIIKFYGSKVVEKINALNHQI